MRTRPILWIVMVGLAAALLAAWLAASDGSSAAQREAMVSEQIEARGVRDPAVLKAMREVERHRFVPLLYRSLAYSDRPLPIGEGQTISQPYIVALMSESLTLAPGARILEVGTGSGYQAAVLAQMGHQVWTIEIVPSLADSARNLLRDQGYGAVQVRTGDGYLGWPEAAPFDAVIVTCAPDHVPQPLCDQLAEGGRMCIPVGSQETGQSPVRIRKVQGKLQREELLPVSFVPLVRPAGTGAGQSARSSQ